MGRHDTQSRLGRLREAASPGVHFEVLLSADACFLNSNTVRTSATQEHRLLRAEGTDRYSSDNQLLRRDFEIARKEEDYVVSSAKSGYEREMGLLTA